MTDILGETGLGTCDTATDEYELVITKLAEGCGMQSWSKFTTVIQMKNLTDIKTVLLVLRLLPSKNQYRNHLHWIQRRTYQVLRADGRIRWSTRCELCTTRFDQYIYEKFLQSSTYLPTTDFTELPTTDYTFEPTTDFTVEPTTDYTFEPTTDITTEPVPTLELCPAMEPEEECEYTLVTCL